MRRVVITGTGVVSPIGIGAPAFFDGLRLARSGVGPIRGFDARALPTRVAAEVPPIDLSTVRLPEREAAAMRRDRKSLFGLLAGREALASAFATEAPSAHYDPIRCGVMVATGLEIFNLEDLAPFVSAAGIDGAGLIAAVRAAPALAYLQIPSDLAARALAREAQAMGLFSVNVSACAAGTQAIGEAFLAIGQGACDMVLTGGYDSMVNPLGVGGFCLLEALSRRNDLGPAASRPFHRERDGFVLGEGAGMVVLEEYEAARRRGAPLLAELLGFGSTLDAYRVTDPAPDHRAAEGAMRMALERAGIAPEEIDYINAHGTGTPKNDPAETQAIHLAFGAAAARVPVSSTKSQIGHLIGAAGAVELIAGLFAMREGLLPATITLTRPDPQCDLDYVPLTPRPAEVRTFLSNSFGFGGQNASIVVGRVR